VVIRSDEAAAAQRFHLVLNWFPEVKRRAVSGR
jgi:hypothetical protein